MRTKVIGLVNLSGIPPLSTGLIEKQFEFLGSLNYCQDNGKTFNRRTYYRLLHEDPGCLIFTDSILKDFLQREYGRLFLAREIREIKDMGETKTGASIFSAEINRQRSEAILRPLWPGADLDANVDRHLRFLKAESLNNILFELDLGVSWQASLMPILVNRQFVPKLIIPFAGRADLLYFQYDGT